MKKWEYQTISIPDSVRDVAEKLNEHGAQGWEVVSDAADTGFGLSYLMKRELTECTYEIKWTDEVGDIPVCILHGQNSRHHVDLTHLHEPCLTVDPYPENVDRALSRGEIENMLNMKLEDWQWERLWRYVWLKSVA